MQYPLFMTEDERKFHATLDTVETTLTELQEEFDRQKETDSPELLTTAHAILDNRLDIDLSFLFADIEREIAKYLESDDYKSLPEAQRNSFEKLLRKL